MNLGDIEAALRAPFPSEAVYWTPAAMAQDRSRALLLANVDARAVMNRLDLCAPGGWEFRAQVVGGAVHGSLTVLGVTREDFGTGGDDMGDGLRVKVAAGDALKRCAVLFGVGRYLYELPKVWADWNDQTRKPTHAPELPAWAVPAEELGEGAAHLRVLLDRLRHELPLDVETRRALYGHLNAAVKLLDQP